MSTFTDLEKDAASVDGFVNENGLIPTRRNGPKPSYQYLVDGWNAEIAATILELNKSRGFRVVGTFADGFTYELFNDVGIDADGNSWIYVGAGAPNKVVSAGTVPSVGEGYQQVTFNNLPACDISNANGGSVQDFIDKNIRVSDVNELTSLSITNDMIGYTVDTGAFDLTNQPEGYAASKLGAVGGATYTVMSKQSADIAAIPYWSSGSILGYFAFLVDSDYVLRIASNKVDITQLGAVPIIGSVTPSSFDSHKPISNSCFYFDEVTGDGEYYLSKTLNIKTRVHLHGVALSGAGSEKHLHLRFADDCVGIFIHRYNTNADDKGVPFIELPETGRADGSVLEYIQASMVTHPDASDELEDKGLHGIWLKVRAVVRNCTFERWRGNAIHIVGYGTSSDAYLAGNCNSITFENVLGWRSAGKGHYVDGPDANAGKFEQLSCYHNGKNGSHDDSFLGNTYISCNFGLNYKQGTPEEYPDLLQTNANARCVYLGQYVEGVGAYIKGAGTSIIMGGLIDSSNIIDIAYIRSSGNKMFSEASYSHSRFVGTEKIISTIGGDSGSVVETSSGSTLNIWRLQWVNDGQDLVFRNSNATPRTAFEISSESTTRSFGTPTPKPYQFSQNQLAFGTSGGGRRMFYLSALPSVGEFAKGDIIWTRSASAGGSPGWYCVTGGDAGVTAVFKEMSSIEL